jgi:hypothetical protein
MLSQSKSIHIKILCAKTQQHTLTPNSKSLSGMHTSRSLTKISTNLIWVIGQSHNIQLPKNQLDHNILLEAPINLIGQRLP